MSNQFRPIKRDVLYLLPPAIQDWLPQDHLAQQTNDQQEVVPALEALAKLERTVGLRANL